MAELAYLAMLVPTLFVQSASSCKKVQQPSIRRRTATAIMMRNSRPRTTNGLSENGLIPSTGKEKEV